MKNLFAIALNGCSLLDQLKLEEALLRTQTDNFFLYNTEAPEAIVMGISGKWHELIDDAIYSKNPVPVLRRFSGGGCVFIDKDSCLTTLICNEMDTKIPPYPKEVLNWTAALYEPLFPSKLFRVAENDYALDTKKVGGNAQYFTKKRWLHHTSLLWDYQNSNMAYLKMPPKIPAYRKTREHHEFLGKLKDSLPSKNSLFQGLLEELKKKFSIKNMSIKDALQLATLPHRQSTIEVTGP